MRDIKLRQWLLKIHKSLQVNLTPCQRWMLYQQPGTGVNEKINVAGESVVWTFSLRMSSSSKLTGGSIAKRAIVCIKWLCTMSRMIPCWSKYLIIHKQMPSCTALLEVEDWVKERHIKTPQTASKLHKNRTYPPLPSMPQSSASSTCEPYEQPQRIRQYGISRF